MIKASVERNRALDADSPSFCHHALYMLEHLITLLGAGHFGPLTVACQNILRTQPQAALAHHALGLIHAWSGRFEEAVTHLTESLRPPFPPTPFLHLAHILHHGLADTPRALAVLEKGLSLNSVNPELLQLHRWMVTPGPSNCSGEASAAESLLSRKMGADHRLAGRHEEAAQTVIQGLLHAPLDAGLLEEFGLCRQAEGQHEESAGCFRALTRILPKNAEAWCHLGAALLASGNPEEATPALEAAIQIRPQWHLPLRHIAMAQLQGSQHEAAQRSLQQCTQLAPEDTVSLSQHLFSLNYLPTHLQMEMPALYKSASERFGPLLSRPRLPDRLPGRLKIGYISADFSNHPVAYFLEPLFEHRDRVAFELFAYSNSPKIDHTTLRLKALCDHWRDVWPLTDASLYSQIRRDGIHILVDLSGHTPGNRLKVFARRPAPLQVTMIGCMQTTGLPCMDLRITDRFLNPSPPAAYESETLLFMDSGAVAFRPPDESPEVAELPCLSGTPFTYASLNDPAKVTEETLTLWAEILQKTPGSKLLLIRRPGSRLKDALRSLGVSAERVKEVGYAPLQTYLQMHGEVDLALDPFPYNGLTVTLLACWMGVPAVTLVGAAPPARTAANVLERMGLSEFVCASPESYVDTAVQMFRAPSALASVRRDLRRRTEMAWCCGSNYTREFEKKIQSHLQDAIPRKNSS